MTSQVQKLRQQIFAFYEEHDPEKLRTGVDVDGMANWAAKMGEQCLNDLLSLQYGATIDFSKPLPDQEQQVEQFEEVFAPEVSHGSEAFQSIDRETVRREDLKQKLTAFYEQQDPAVSGDAIDDLVEAGVLHGEERLNRDLAEKYGQGFLSSTGRSSSAGKRGSGGEEDKQHEEYDELKVRAELRKFYSKHDPAYLETPDHMDQVMNLMSQVGKKAVYDKLFGFYGVRVEEAEGEEEGGEEEEQIKDVDKLRRQLKMYYEKYDKEEVENIDDVIELGMDIGMSQLNQNMESLYGTSLTAFVAEVEKAGNNKKVSKLRQMHQIKSKKMLKQKVAPKKNPSVKSFRKSPVKDKEPPKPTPRTVPVPLPKTPERASRTVSEKPLPPTSRMIKRPDKPPKMPDRQNVTETERSKRIEREKKEAELQSDEVTEEELRNFYSKHDKEKLGHMAKILKVAAKIGRRNLNKKLMGFYGADLQTYEEGAADEEEEEEGEDEEEEEVDYDDLDQLREDLKMYYEEVDPMKINDLDQIVQLGKRLGRRVLVKKLFKIYNKSVDEISGRVPPSGHQSESEQSRAKTEREVSAKSAPRISSEPPPPLPEDEEEEDVEEQQPPKVPPRSPQRQLPPSPSRRLPSAPRPVSKTRKVPSPVSSSKKVDRPVSSSRKVERPVSSSKKVDRPVSSSRKVERPVSSSKKVARKPPLQPKPIIFQQEPQLIRTMKIEKPDTPTTENEEEEESRLKVRKKYRAPDLPQMMNIPPGAKMKSNIQIKALKEKGIPVVPIMGINLSEVGLKKTGRNVNKTLRKVKSKKKQMHSLYQLPKRQRNYTAASMKLLSVNLRASNNSTAVDQDKNVAAKLKPKAKPKVDIGSLVSEVKEPNLADGPCSNYKLNMKNKGTFGVCFCGFTRAQHSKKAMKKEV